MGDIIVISALALAVALVIASLVRRKKKGACGGCSGCAGCSGCCAGCNSKGPLA